MKKKRLTPDDESRLRRLKEETGLTSLDQLNALLISQGQRPMRLVDLCTEDETPAGLVMFKKVAPETN
jgi:hypothetical protein